MKINKVHGKYLYYIWAAIFFYGLTFMQVPLANAGKASEEYFTGLNLEYNPDQNSDYNLAAVHYEKAAQAGSREAYLALAKLYAPEGPLWSTPEQWRVKLQSAAAAGWPEAAYRLAQALENGSVTADELNYMDYYFQAAAACYGPAALKIGESYLSGQVLAHDNKSAALWLAVAAKNGEEKAAILLGRHYYESNSETAIRWLQLAQDNVEAQYLLGELYFRQKRFIEAVASLTYAADHGHPEANLSLGMININNDFGRKSNTIEALRNFKIAAQADLPEGCYQLGRMYLNGISTPKDPLTAAFWFHKAGELGHKEALAEYDKLLLHFSLGQKKALERMTQEGVTPTMRTRVK